MPASAGWAAPVPRWRTCTSSRSPTTRGRSARRAPTSPRLESELGPSYRPPRHAALAVATPVSGDEVSFTNSHWSFSQRQLREALGLASLRVLNDFEALALSLPHLDAIAAARAWRLAARRRHAGGGRARHRPGRGRRGADAAWLAGPARRRRAQHAGRRRRLRGRGAACRAAAARPCVGRAAAVGHRPADPAPVGRARAGACRAGCADRRADRRDGPRWRRRGVRTHAGHLLRAAGQLRGQRRADARCTRRRVHRRRHRAAHRRALLRLVASARASNPRAA